MPTDPRASPVFGSPTPSTGGRSAAACGRPTTVGRPGTGSACPACRGTATSWPSRLRPASSTRSTSTTAPGPALTIASSPTRRRPVDGLADHGRDRGRTGPPAPARPARFGRLADRGGSGRHRGCPARRRGVEAMAAAVPGRRRTGDPGGLERVGSRGGLRRGSLVDADRRPRLPLDGSGRDLQPCRLEAARLRRRGCRGPGAGRHLRRREPVRGRLGDRRLVRRRQDLAGRPRPAGVRLLRSRPSRPTRSGWRSASRSATRASAGPSC